MPFLIQVNNPTYCKIVKQECDTIEDLLEDVILLDSEYCIMFWNYTAIPLCYKYDISILFYDVIFMIDTLSASTMGCLDIHWPSNTFSAHWNLIWDHNKLTISSQWYSVIGDIEDVLNNKNKLHTTKSSFLEEWEKLINKIITIIQSLQYTHKESLMTKLYDTKTKLLNKKINPLL